MTAFLPIGLGDVITYTISSSNSYATILTKKGVVYFISEVERFATILVLCLKPDEMPLFCSYEVECTPIEVLAGHVVVISPTPNSDVKSYALTDKGRARVERVPVIIIEKIEKVPLEELLTSRFGAVREFARTFSERIEASKKQEEALKEFERLSVRNLEFKP